MEQPPSGRPVEILLVEDNPGDAALTREAMRDAKVYNNLYVVPDGVEAMAFLRGLGRHANAPRPDLILLDLNLPRKDGRTVLEEIKADPALATIPVVVLTASEAEEDIVRAYHLRVSAYIIKPVTLGQIMRVVQSIEDFWLSIVSLPPAPQGLSLQEARP
jgi:CheY-like chemotaxis protein